MSPAPKDTMHISATRQALIFSQAKAERLERLEMEILFAAVVGFFFFFLRDTDINTQRFCSVLFLQQVHSSTAMAYFPGTFPVSLSLTAWQLRASLFSALTHFTFFTSLSEILKKTSELTSQHLTASFLFSLAMSVLPLAPHVEQGCLQHTHPSQLKLLPLICSVSPESQSHFRFCRNIGS